jgi:hypothetical protein
MTVENFYNELLQEIKSTQVSEEKGAVQEQIFTQIAIDLLAEAGETENARICFDRKEDRLGRTMHKLNGYALSENYETLDLFITVFKGMSVPFTLTKQETESASNQVERFFRNAVYKDYVNEIEESSEVFDLAHTLAEVKEVKEFLSRVNIFILTNGIFKSDIKLSKVISGYSIFTRVIDIEYLFNLSDQSRVPIEINFNDYGQAIPCLKSPGENEDYETYLALIPGVTLANIYEEYGSRLLEQNVRSFLQFTGKINKGIRKTIKEESHMFLAFNNGIAATADELNITTSPDGHQEIVWAKDFQIVNGGQTTSAVYAAKRNSKIDVSKINIQMKLSVVSDKKKQDDFVSKVSEYANTQNKVNKSDFFSNSPFHKEYKDYSKRIWAPVSSGAQQRTHWFYERVRGEYLNEQAYLTKSQKKQFQIENPKKQMINKTFLAKSENLWDLKPYIVSKGAQYSFDEFAKSKTEEIEKNGLAINEKYFKDSVGRIIIFKETERIISKADWYNGGYRAQAVAYTISYFAYLIQSQGYFFNFDEIWKNQRVEQEIIEILLSISEKIYENITNPPEGNANIGQWCKKEQAWVRVKNLNLNITLSDKFLLDKEENYYNKQVAKKEKKILKGIEMQVFVVEQQFEKWVSLFNYYLKENFSNLTTIQRGVLKSFVDKKISLPTERQSKVLYELYDRAINEGFKW